MWTPTHLHTMNAKCGHEMVIASVIESTKTQLLGPNGMKSTNWNPLGEPHCGTLCSNHGKTHGILIIEHHTYYSRDLGFTNVSIPLLK